MPHARKIGPAIVHYLCYSYMICSEMIVILYQKLPLLCHYTNISSSVSSLLSVNSPLPPSCPSDFPSATSLAFSTSSPSASTLSEASCAFLAASSAASFAFSSASCALLSACSDVSLACCSASFAFLSASSASSFAFFSASSASFLSFFSLSNSWTPGSAPRHRPAEANYQ